MSDAELVVEWAGPSTTIQDAGRPGFMRYGVPASGPMDRAAFAAARALAGPDLADAPRGAAIEISLGGLRLACVEGEVGFAIAGGGFRVSRDGVPLGSWTAGTLAAGSKLSIEPGGWGCWTYLAFAGEIEAAAWLGGIATHAPSGLGGGGLAAGTRIRVMKATRAPLSPGDAPWPAPPRRAPRLRIVLGPQEDCFTGAAISALLTGEFRLGRQFDRVGSTLEGPALPIARALDLPSSPIVRGSLQVPGAGPPVLLMADHQTSGGYPRIATLIDADQDRFAQLRPGDPLSFAQVSGDEAVEIARRGRAAALTERGREGRCS